jgi:hypothetical protein
MTKTRKDFQQLVAMRAKEAQALAKSGNQNGAYYLGGFVIECALKACIAKKTMRHDFPADRHYANLVYSHDLTQLLRLAGLEAGLEREMKTNPRLAANWGVVKTWNVESRYETSTLNGADMVAAVKSSKDGVLKWIKHYW